MNLVGINTVQGAAERLALLDGNGALRTNGTAVVEFCIKNISGIASPLNRLNQGFINGGLTGGGAREWVIDSAIQIFDVTVRYLK